MLLLNGTICRRVSWVLPIGPGLPQTLLAPAPMPTFVGSNRQHTAKKRVHFRLNKVGRHFERIVHSTDREPLTFWSPVMKSPIVATQEKGWSGRNSACNQKHTCCVVEIHNQTLSTEYRMMMILLDCKG